MNQRYLLPILLLALFCCHPLLAAPGDGEPAIALWSLPERAELGPDTPTVGVVAYHALGIERVEFVHGGKVVSVADREVLHKTTGEMEYVADLSSVPPTADESVTITARVVPRGGGTATQLGARIFYVAGLHESTDWIVDTEKGSDDTGDGSKDRPFATIEKALTMAKGGDRVWLGEGVYDLPLPRDHDFGRYVTVRPLSDAEVRITSTGNLRCGWLKFEDLWFDWRGQDSHAIIGTYSASHLWFTRCRFEGTPGRFNNYTLAIKLWGDVTDITVENCEFRYLDKAVAACPNAILRGNLIEDLTSDAFNFGSNTLISGNTIRRLKAPQMVVMSGRQEPYDVSVEGVFQVSHSEMRQYHTYELDLAQVLPTPEKATAEQVAAALNKVFAEQKPDRVFGLRASAEEGRVRIACLRTNMRQLLYVEGAANRALGFAPEGKDKELSGSGQHADVFQYWGGLKENIIVRNNLAYDNSAQQWLAADSPTRNLAFVNNLLDAYYETSWAIMLGGTYENVLIEFNTVWNANQSVVMRKEMFEHGNNRGLVIRNNILGIGTGMGALDDASQFTTEYNLYDYHRSTPKLGPHSIDANPGRTHPSEAHLFEHVLTRTSDSGAVDYYQQKGDFTPAPGSPAVDAGSPASGIAYDILWCPRDAKPDMGAFERPVQQP